MDAVAKKADGVVEKVKRACAGKTFTPNVDIINSEKAFTLIADMPGVNEKSVDITLEKNVLTITGSVTPCCGTAGYEETHREYEVGDYSRSFTITDEIDKEKIEAVVKNGVLRLTLPRKESVSRQITVKAA